MLAHTPTVAIVGGTVIAGHYAGRLARRGGLPSLIGFMVLGTILGPSLLAVLARERLDQLGFLTETSLGLVALSIGAELRLSALADLGGGIVSIILAESFLTFFVVTGAVWALTGNLPLALLFGAVAPASAPAGTVAVIQECRAKGPLTRALYAVVGFDDGLAILIFGFAAAMAENLLLSHATGAHPSLLAAMRQPCVEIAGSLGLGLILGLPYAILVSRQRGSAERLILTTGFVLLATGLAVAWHLSLILTNLIMGMLLANMRSEDGVMTALAPLRQVMPLVFILFFSLAGAHLDVRALPSLGVLGAVYVVARSAGLVGGARLGAALGRVHPTVARYVGLGILSQAGVAIGLSLIVQHDLAALAARHGRAFAAALRSAPSFDPVTIGATVITTVSATCVFFEILGPILTRYALAKAGEIHDGSEASTTTTRVPELRAAPNEG